MAEDTARLTLRDLARLKARGEKIAMLTAYDATFAAVLDRAGVEVLLVGDTLGPLVQGQPTTLPVSMDEMVYHCRAVVRGARRALVMADMPFLSYTDAAAALANAGRLLKEAGVQMVKLECSPAQEGIVAALAAEGIPVCAHLGLRPQSVHKLGGYRVQGRDPAAAEALLEAAARLEAAGADLLLLEAVPAALAGRVRAQAGVPVIGIGAGPDCDGQVLVLYDLLGLTERLPRFAKNFLAEADGVEAAVRAYVAAVKTGRFPGPEHSY
ncbi:MAG: 3-methyl-2-oxobutanoate hydroxymethyltransferase [Gammaproteobacteria bacterium]|nr:MAG: 3-methyl-2-oxobutanoate hydroxymethyltransferase [Gammaproteobacteria bacterium]